MLISTGNKALQYVMPALTGKKAEEALKIIDRIGLQHRVITRPGDKETDRTGSSSTKSRRQGHPLPWMRRWILW